MITSTHSTQNEGTSDFCHTDCGCTLSGEFWGVSCVTSIHHNSFGWSLWDDPLNRIVLVRIMCWAWLTSLNNQKDWSFVLTSLCKYTILKEYMLWEIYKTYISNRTGNKIKLISTAISLWFHTRNQAKIVRLDNFHNVWTSCLAT